APGLADIEDVSVATNLIERSPQVLSSLPRLVALEHGVVAGADGLRLLSACADGVRLGAKPLGGDAREAGRQDQEQPGCQARSQRIPLAGSPGAFQEAAPP